MSYAVQLDAFNFSHSVKNNEVLLPELTGCCSPPCHTLLPSYYLPAAERKNARRA